MLAKLVLCWKTWQSVSGRILKLIGSKTNVCCSVHVSGSCVIWTRFKYCPTKVELICHPGYTRHHRIKKRQISTSIIEAWSYVSTLKTDKTAGHQLVKPTWWRILYIFKLRVGGLHSVLVNENSAHYKAKEFDFEPVYKGRHYVLNMFSLPNSNLFLFRNVCTFNFCLIIWGFFRD